MDESLQKPGRGRLRFTLRFLLLLVVVVAIPLAWKVNRVRNQRLAVAEVARVSGRIVYDYQYNRGGQKPGSQEPPGPAWMRRWLGDDYFSDVINVIIDDPRADADTLAQVSRLPGLELLHVKSDGVTDLGLAALEDSSELESLLLGSSNITDAGLVHLRGLKKLKRFVLVAPQITDHGLRHLAALPHRNALPNCRVHWRDQVYDEP